MPAIGKRLNRRDQAVPAVADQVGAAHVLERLAPRRPVVRIVVAQEGFVRAAALGVGLNDHALGPLVRVEALERLEVATVNSQGSCSRNFLPQKGVQRSAGILDNGSG
jgi:hypothetical protein